MKIRSEYVKAIVLLCLVGLVTAIGTNEITTSGGNLLLNSSSGTINVELGTTGSLTLNAADASSENIAAHNTGATNYLHLQTYLNATDYDELGIFPGGFQLYSSYPAGAYLYPYTDGTYTFGSSDHEWAVLNANALTSQVALNVNSAGTNFQSGSVAVTGDVNASGAVKAVNVYGTNVYDGAHVSTGAFAQNQIMENASWGFRLTLNGAGANTLSLQQTTNAFSGSTSPFIINAGNITIDRSLNPATNNSQTIGRAGLLYSTIYVKSTVTSDAFYNGDPEYLIREVERPGEGLAKEFIPKTLLTENGCDTAENQTECWSRIGDENWDSLNHITDTYDGDVITSDGLSVRDTVAENQALKQVMLDNGLMTEEQLSAAKQTIVSARPVRLGGGLRA
jgi:hypothetical protein